MAAPLHSPELELRGIQLYRLGLSSIAVGERLGVHHTTVLYWLRKWGIPRRPRPGCPYAQPDLFGGVPVAMQDGTRKAG